jgi:hypothetical protein
MSALESRGDGTLVDLLDRLLSGGVVLAGDITLTVADVDLVRVRLLALVASVPTAMPTGAPPQAPA